MLHRVDRPLPSVKKPSPNADKFISRGDTPLTDQVVGACDASPAECAARVRQLQQGTSPEAKAALAMHAINVGLSLGNMMAQGMTAGPRGTAAMPRGSNTDMRSLAPRPIRSAPGQGAPTGPVQRNIQSDIRLQ